MGTMGAGQECGRPHVPLHIFDQKTEPNIDRQGHVRSLLIHPHIVMSSLVGRAVLKQVVPVNGPKDDRVVVPVSHHIAAHSRHNSREIDQLTKARLLPEWNEVQAVECVAEIPPHTRDLFVHFRIKSALKVLQHVRRDRAAHYGITQILLTQNLDFQMMRFHPTLLSAAQLRSGLHTSLASFLRGCLRSKGCRPKYGIRTLCENK